MKTQPDFSTDSLPAAKVIQLVFLSFYFSQGRQEIQQDMFTWLSAQYPNYRISKGARDQALPKLTNAIRKRVECSTTKPTLHPHFKQDMVDEIEQQSKEALDLLFETLTAFWPPTDIGKLVGYITTRLLKQDARYIDQGRNRNNCKPDAKSPLLDPWLSHLCYYALLQHGTGLTEYDELFLQIRMNLSQLCSKQNPHSKEDREYLHTIVSAYNSKHPDHQASLPPPS